jgi:hypothetical protein
LAHVTYYAVVSGNGTAESPSGLVRRSDDGVGLIDESLRRDLTWGHTSAIAEWERDAMDFDLVEIGEGAAHRLIDRFRAEWAGEG